MIFKNFRGAHACPQCPLVSMHATTACGATTLTTLSMLPMALYLQTLCIMNVKKQYQVYYSLLEVVVTH